MINSGNASALEFKEKGNTFYKNGDFLEALLAYSNGIQRDGNDSSLWGNRAATYFKLGMYDKAIEDSKFAIELNPILPRYYWCMGESHLKLGQFFLARLAFENGLKHDPCNDQIRSALNERREGEPTKDGSIFSEDLAEKKKKANKFKDEGNELYKMFKFNEALEKYSQAVLLDPAQSIFYNNRAAAYSELQKYNEVIKDTEYAVVLERTNAVSRENSKPADPKFIAKAYMRRAVAYERMQNFEKALQALEEGIREEDIQPLRERIAAIKKNMN